MEENLEKKLALLDFLDIDYFLHTDNIYYYGEEFDYSEDAIIEEVLEYKENNNPDCSECDNYLVLTDNEADEKWNEHLENYIERYIIPELPKCYQSYFDNESWKSDAKYDGRGHCLSSENGIENEQSGYYIYKIS
jgi:carboxypeptidase C (cathepsin A)